MKSPDTVETLRRAALETFATDGLGATVRAVADHAGMSHGLIRHHFGSRDGLRAAVDAFVIERILQAFALDPADDETGGDHIVDEMFARRRERVAQFGYSEPHIAMYMGRLLTEDPAAGQSLFNAMTQGLRQELDVLIASGAARPHPDLDVVAVQIVLLELGAIALRPLIEQKLGFSLTSREGARRWVNSALELLSQGIYISPPQPDQTTE